MTSAEIKKVLSVKSISETDGTILGVDIKTGKVIHTTSCFASPYIDSLNLFNLPIFPSKKLYSEVYSANSESCALDSCRLL